MVCTRRGGRPCPPSGTHPQNGRANANTHHVCRGRCPHRPARRTSVFTIRCGKPAIAQRADRVVRPYRTFFVFAENACNFVIACRRVDVGIDPYGDFALLPFVMRICFCILRGRRRTPPLRKIITFFNNNPPFLKRQVIPRAGAAERGPGGGRSRRWGTGSCPPRRTGGSRCRAPGA